MIKEIVIRLCRALIALVVLAEVLVQTQTLLRGSDPFNRILSTIISAFLHPYIICRSRALDLVDKPIVGEIRRIWIWLLLVIIVASAALYFVRRAMLAWKSFANRLFGGESGASTYQFKSHCFELFDTLRAFGGKLKAQDLLLGKTEKKELFVITSKQRTHQTQMIGKTGSGKSTLLEGMLYQDIASGKGAIVIDGKGELAFAEKVHQIVEAANREHDLSFFSLAYPSNSCGYNPIHMRTEEEILPVCQRVFSVFDMDEPYFRQQAESYFIDLVTLLHGTGKEFTLQDVYRCMITPAAFEKVVEHSSARSAAHRIQMQMERLGREAFRTLSGLESWIRKYSSIEPLNKYESDSSISIRDVIAENRIVYFQLPGAFHQIYSTAVGKILLQDIQMEAARRQIVGGEFDYFPIYVDEFYNFAYPGFMDAINKGRSAKFMWTLSHQSMADLERISAEFAQGVWDNTRNKIILSQNNHELCDKIAKDIGTVQTEARTERETTGWLWTKKRTGESSNRKVDEFIFNPNRIKQLSPVGQGYFINEEMQVGLNFPYLQLANSNKGLPILNAGSVSTVDPSRQLLLHREWEQAENRQITMEEYNNEESTSISRSVV